MSKKYVQHLKYLNFDQMTENNKWEPPLIRVNPGEVTRHLPGIPGPRPPGSIMPVPGHFLGGMGQGHFLNSRLGNICFII